MDLVVVSMLVFFSTRSCDNSPAIYRRGWEEGDVFSVRRDDRRRGSECKILASLRDAYNLNDPIYPAVNCWAIIKCPYGTE